MADDKKVPEPESPLAYRRRRLRLIRDLVEGNKKIGDRKLSEGVAEAIVDTMILPEDEGN